MSEKKLLADGDVLSLATSINNIATGLQYDPSGMWGAETVGPINAAAAELRRQHAEIEWLREHAVVLAETARQVEHDRCAKLLPPIDAALRIAADRTREDLGPDGSNYPDVRTLLAFAEQAIAAKP